MRLELLNAFFAQIIRGQQVEAYATAAHAIRVITAKMEVCVLHALLGPGSCRMDHPTAYFAVLEHILPLLGHLPFRYVKHALTLQTRLPEAAPLQTVLCCLAIVLLGMESHSVSESKRTRTQMILL